MLLQRMLWSLTRFFFLLGESESDLDQDNASVDALSSLGTEAIEKLASGLNKAANTIEGYSQNVSCFLVFSILKKFFGFGNIDIRVTLI